MPKEVVYGQQVAFDENDPNPQVPIIEVRWNREGGYVQVVSKTTDPHGGRLAQSGDAPGETHVTDGYHVDIDRAAINKLIRDLRRARDQAFGRDE